MLVFLQISRAVKGAYLPVEILSCRRSSASGKATFARKALLGVELRRQEKIQPLAPLQLGSHF